MMDLGEEDEDGSDDDDEGSELNTRHPAAAQRTNETDVRGREFSPEKARFFVVHSPTRVSFSNVQCSIACFFPRIFKKLREIFP